MFDSIQSDARGKLLLRLTVGILMLFHGVAKIMNPGTLEYIGTSIASMGYGLPPAIAYGVYLGEVVAPLMIIFGLFSRIGGFIVAANMLVAIVLVHVGDVFALTSHGGWQLELQAFYLLGGLSIMLLGSGRIAIRAD